MNKLSAFIITKNEERLISKAILSLRDIADEVIIVDSGSTDKTVEIAKDLGAKVYFNEWSGYVKQKSFAESLCKNDWVINIDADEELSQELRDEIDHIFQSSNQDSYLAYRINFVIMHRKDSTARYLAPANKFIRIYNRKFASFANTLQYTTRDSVRFNKDVDSQKKIYDLNGIAYHRSGTSIEQLVAKANFYSGQQAVDMVNAGRTVSNLRVAFELPLCFLKAYFKRRYFIFGFDGFVDSLIFAFARFLRMAKTRELQNKDDE